MDVRPVVDAGGMGSVLLAGACLGPTRARSTALVTLVAYLKGPESIGYSLVLLYTSVDL